MLYIIQWVISGLILAVITALAAYPSAKQGLRELVSNLKKLKEELRRGKND